MYRLALTICCGLLIGLTACHQDPPLPYLGFPQYNAVGDSSAHQLAHFHFIDHHGQELDSRSLEGRISVMNYFFTSCPTICPRMTDNLAKIRHQLSDADDVVFLSFSVDPKRDDPARLRSFMKSHQIDMDDDGWYFLTGDKQTLYDFAKKQLYLTAMEENVPIDQDFIHSEQAVLVDKDRHIRGFYNCLDERDLRQLTIDIGRLQSER